MADDQERLAQITEVLGHGEYPSVTESRWLLSAVRDQAEQIAALQERIAAQNKWARSSMAGVVAGREAMRAERDALQDRIDKALAWLDEADPLPELNGDMFRDLRNYLTVDAPTEGELT